MGIYEREIRASIKRHMVAIASLERELREIRNRESVSFRERKYGKANTKEETI